MRKLVLGLTSLGVAFAILGASASGAQAATLNLVAEQQGEGHRIPNGFVFHERLFSDGEHVGRNRIEITRSGRRSFDVVGLFRFQGGKIRVAGPGFRGGSGSIPIVGGKGRYHGITGNLFVKDLDDGLTRETFRFRFPR